MKTIQEQVDQIIEDENKKHYIGQGDCFCDTLFPCNEFKSSEIGLASEIKQIGLSARERGHIMVAVMNEVEQAEKISAVDLIMKTALQSKLDDLKKVLELLK